MESKSYYVSKTDPTTYEVVEYPTNKTILGNCSPAVAYDICDKANAGQWDPNKVYYLSPQEWKALDEERKERLRINWRKSKRKEREQRKSEEVGNIVFIKDDPRAKTLRNQEVVYLRETCKYDWRTIGNILGISFQRAHQIYRKHAGKFSGYGTNQ